MKRHELHFDQYQRYEDLRRTVLQMPRSTSTRPLRILDIGGNLGNNETANYLPVTDFLADQDCYAVDINYCLNERFIRGSGLSLPFAAGSFDVVAAQDTLEHIAPSVRPVFLQEILRVSRSLVIISGPLYSPATESADRYLADFLKEVLHGTNPCLGEHLHYGLPHFADIRQLLERSGRVVERIPSGSLHAWLQMMILKHFLLLLPGSERLHHFLDSYYNHFIYDGDHWEPAYRSIVLAGPPEMAPFLKRVRQFFLRLARP